MKFHRIDRFARASTIGVTWVKGVKILSPRDYSPKELSE
jgi:hypothetical protein